MLISIPLLAHKHIPATHVELLSGAAAIGGVFAEFFLINSLLVWDPKAPAAPLPDDDDDLEPTSPQWRRGLVRLCWLGWAVNRVTCAVVNGFMAAHPCLPVAPASWILVMHSKQPFLCWCSPPNA